MPIRRFPILLLLAAACQSIAIDMTDLACNDDGQCALGFVCGPDGICITRGAVGDSRPGDETGGDPNSGDTAFGDPVAGDPASGDPTSGDRGFGDPGFGDPRFGDPGFGDPGFGDPGFGDPGFGDPGFGDPDSGDPGGCTPSVIAFDAANRFNRNSASQLVWSHTTTSAANGERILLVGVGMKYVNGDEDAVTVTYGGVDLTILDSASSGIGEESRIEVWYLLNPASGTDDVVVNLGASTRVAAGSMTFTGVDQAAPEAVNTNVLAFSGSGEPTVTVTTITDNAWVVDMLTWRRDRDATPASAQTERYQVTQHWAVAGSTVGPVTPPATITMDWTVTMDPTWAVGVVSLAPECL